MAAAFVILLFGACSLEYDDSELAESIPEDVPDSTFRDYVFTSARNGEPVYRIYAETARLYHSKHEAELEEVLFREFGPDGEIVTEGTAETAKVNTVTDDVQLRGNLRFASSIYEAEIRADQLFWDGEEELLKSPEDEAVTILRENGTRIRGKGLRAHTSSRTVEFTASVEGSYVYEEDDAQQ